MNIYFNTPCSLELEKKITNLLENANLFNGEIAGKTLNSIQK